jgi:hypothetical protein
LSTHNLHILNPRKSSDFNATVLPDGRWLLYNQSVREAVTLTAPAGILWELCDGQTSAAALIQQLQELYPDTPPALLETETLSLLDHFMEQGIVTNSTG